MCRIRWTQIGDGHGQVLGRPSALGHHFPGTVVGQPVWAPLLQGLRKCLLRACLGWASHLLGPCGVSITAPGRGPHWAQLPSGKLKWRLSCPAGLTGPTAFHSTLQTYMVRGLGRALLKKVLGKPEDPVCHVLQHPLPTPFDSWLLLLGRGSVR